MSFNMVTVAITTVDSPADTTTVEGHYCFVPSGVQWPSIDGDSVIVPAVIQGPLTNGTANVSLLASDNFASGILTWNVLINIRGIPTINVADVPVNFSDGASQNIFTILTNNAGWTPVQT